jgi:hypothetical protein
MITRRHHATPDLADRRPRDRRGCRLVGARGVDERGDTALLYELELREPDA